MTDVVMSMNDVTEWVESLVYLGDKLKRKECFSVVTTTIHRLEEVQAVERNYLVESVLCGRESSIQLMQNVYETCVRMATVKSNEMWVMRKVEENVIEYRETYGAYDE